MKKHFVFVLILLPLIAYGKYEYGFLHEFYFGRVPGARAEAMGKGYCALDGDMTSVFYNPAGIVSLQGLHIYSSFSSPYYFSKSAKYNYFGAGYKLNDYLIVGLSRNHLTFGEDIAYRDSFGTVSYGTNSQSLYSLTLSSQPLHDLMIGLNTNIFNYKALDKNFTSFYCDIGLIKKFQLMKNETYAHSVNIAASIMNVTFSSITIDFAGNEIKNDLPVISRFGACYQFMLAKYSLIDSLYALGFSFNAEYKTLLNSQYHSGIHGGMEISLLELLFLRAGYYNVSNYNLVYPEINKDSLSEFTYGMGIQIPLWKLTRIPLNIKFDYTSLPQPSYSEIITDWENFSTYSVQLNWMINY